MPWDVRTLEEENLRECSLCGILSSSLRGPVSWDLADTVMAYFQGER